MIQAGSGTLTLNQQNTYAADTVINSGVLNLANQYAVGTNSTFMGGAGSLQFSSSVTGNAFAFGGLGGQTAINLANDLGSGVALTVGTNGRNTTYAGNLSGPGSLTKIGSGIMTLTGTNNYRGQHDHQCGHRGGRHKGGFVQLRCSKQGGRQPRYQRQR